MDTNRPHITPQGFVGVFIVLLGIVFTLDNLGLVESREILQYWPLAPLGIGLLIVIHANETRDFIRGSIWLGAGSVLLARNLGWLHFRLEAFWPLLLVFFGLHIIFKAREAPEEAFERRANQLRRRQEKWQRRALRWQARHPGRTPPWGTPDWGAEWSKKWNETQAKFQEDWHEKFHEKFHEDWADKLRHSVQTFTTGTSDRDRAPDATINVEAQASGAQAAAGAAGAGASGAGASAGGPYSGTGYAAGANPAPGADPAGAGSYESPRSPWGSNRISMFALMSGVTRRVRNAPFFGANMTAVMGGIELDLRDAALPEDAVIELFAFWGGIEIWVPREWSVVNQGFALMGSIEDKTGNLPQRPGQPRLVLRGMALMGGVEIKN
jgi:predicted membrane protein